ncbi:MAG: hypothetical protein ABR567_19710 [Myxococcales bacterium]
MEPGAVVAGRLVAEGLELRREITGGDRMAAAAGVAPFEEIVGEEPNVGGERFAPNCCESGGAGDIEAGGEKKRDHRSCSSGVPSASGSSLPGT